MINSDILIYIDILLAIYYVENNDYFNRLEKIVKLNKNTK